MTEHWSQNLNKAVFDCNCASGAFLNVFGRTTVPLCDWPTASDFTVRSSPKTGVQAGDYVLLRNRNPKSTMSPRFKDKALVVQRLRNSVKLEDGRQVNLHDAILVRRN